ncbi:PSD1 and planctomycete cytochrome C domain-containing protein [Neorhodopirellula pilleata]|nr:PSD1 and planctomycete cytochrome C domain-containing protein [Neorhodopirellula pilleata]
MSYQQALTENDVRRFHFDLIIVFLTILLGLSYAQAIAAEPLATEQPATSGQLEFFEREVRPLLVEHCYSCHSGTSEKLQAGLRVDSRAALLDGGDSGTAIVSGDADASLFIEAIRYESYEMPPKGKLSDDAIETFERWVEMGAPWPTGDSPVESNAAPEFDLTKRKVEHWAWQPVSAPELPDVRARAWPRAGLDQFILAQLEDAGLQPAADADRSALVRRIYFDLIGLPPTRQQLAEAMADESSGSMARLVDDLLDSPHFGERWGRHWLDLVRYAESRGHEFDNDTPNAHQYRDYTIRALNADVPYDQLVREHIAGDLLPAPRLNPERGFNESILGTGFWFLGEWVHSPVDIRKDESDRFDNMIDVMSKTFLGVTVACARCHDHKFDAISTADYYSLSGFLQSSDYRQVRFESIEKNRQVSAQLAQLDAKYQRQLRDLLDAEGVAFPRQMSYLEDEAIIVDYGNVPQSQFMQDGFAFGRSSHRQGVAYFDFEEPNSVRIASHGAAVSDAFWNGLQSINEGTVRNQSKVAALPKSGRTLRTPTFELRGGDFQSPNLETSTESRRHGESSLHSVGNVSILVHGTGHVVACVDSHRLVAGPLHGETIQPIDAKEERWVTLNLKRYVGHRLHLEFVPAPDARLSVRMAVQGLDGDGLKEIQQRLAATTRPFEKYAAEAEAILGKTGSYKEQVFADFESGTYDGWSATGEAFGEGPQTLETIGSYQGKINGVGKYFVNSHNIRGGGDVQRGDNLTGTLTSRPFVIDFDKIQFWVGGGAHREKTCVNLLVNGERVLSTTGSNNNQMSLKSWDVRQFAGKEARIEVVDKHTSGWGNIGIDHIVFLKHLDGSDANAGGNPAAQRIVDAWRKERTELTAQVVRQSRLAPAMMDGTGEDDRVLIRGNSSKPGELEPRHFLTAISGDEPMRIGAGSGRLELAEHINNPSNPLTSRVIVNRIWHHLMGRGIVPTTDDFGVLGQRPSHPELLDHLATEFVRDGQSIKRMIRRIVLSRTYQMSSHADAQAIQIDPKNMLWHHRPPKRLEGEIIRDTILALSGRLDPNPFGPPVPIHLTAFMDGRGRPGTSGPLDGDGRRSIYIAVRRNFLSPFMLTFDTPVPFSTMGRRNVSNVPAQSLILMNDPFVVEQARKWAERVVQSGSSTQANVIAMYESALAREPTDAELQIALPFLGESTVDSVASETVIERWSHFAHALINTKEFIFLR